MKIYIEKDNDPEFVQALQIYFEEMLEKLNLCKNKITINIVE